MWDDGTIWQGTGEGKLVLKVCRQCAETCHPPLPMCPKCQSFDWENRSATGRATLKSWLISIRPDQAEGESRIVIVAELEEGVRLVSNLIGAALTELREAMPLKLCFEQSDGVILPLFRPVSQT